MKAKQELDALKEELRVLGDKLAELTEEELEQVCGGAIFANDDKLKKLRINPSDYCHLEDWQTSVTGM